MSIDYTKWSKEDLFTEAMRLLTRVNELLTDIDRNCTAKITALKAADYDTLDPRDKFILNCQLEHEAKMGLI